ncbi:MAG TPA: RNA polymerase factor sigma-54 [Candidatus Cloacimonadota bacterium]|nr:RNA polymerase factor sigma-54 [Candidatus Cloacimonadota bacterium]HQL14989.1 RNA polymerase factor sigma-54 [Candidatus Cloacimonadota bacterium]
MAKMNHSLTLGQKQELALKPKMLQSLRMLSLPAMELEVYIRQELINNPLLELRTEKDEEDLEEFTPEPTERESNTPLESPVSDEEQGKTLSEVKELTDILDQWNEFHQEKESGKEEADNERSEALMSYEEDGRFTFLEQLYPYDLTDAEFEFASELVENCNPYGFLPKDFDLYEAAKDYELSRADANRVHKLILSLSPQGITARNLTECLEAQLTPEQKQNRIIMGLISDQFQNLIHRRYQKIASHFGVSEEVILAAREQISHLDPKPGLRILNSSNNYIFPDVTIKKVDEEFVVIINDMVTPNIVISPRYRKMINHGIQDKETVQYVRDKINSAKFLIKSIFMRMRTLERVTQSIIEHQRDFFYNGSGVMVPLTYSVIAQDLGVSESTISRVVKRKYAETPYGIYALKDFFTSTAGRDDNYESVSRQRVKAKILHLIENEDKDNPLSDQELVEKLRAEGLTISRRIIAKYRDEMNILNSRLRKAARK